jgi:hypothetical protein
MSVPRATCSECLPPSSEHRIVVLAGCTSLRPRGIIWASRTLPHHHPCPRHLVWRLIHITADPIHRYILLSSIIIIITIITDRCLLDMVVARGYPHTRRAFSPRVSRNSFVKGHNSQQKNPPINQSLCLYFVFFFFLLVLARVILSVGPWLCGANQSPHPISVSVTYYSKIPPEPEIISIRSTLYFKLDQTPCPVPSLAPLHTPRLPFHTLLFRPRLFVH